MEISKWNKAMESFQELLGWDYGMNVVLDIKKTTCRNKSVPDEVKKDKERIQEWRKDDTS